MIRLFYVILFYHHLCTSLYCIISLTYMWLAMCWTAVSETEKKTSACILDYCEFTHFHTNIVNNRIVFGWTEKAKQSSFPTSDLYYFSQGHQETMQDQSCDSGEAWTMQYTLSIVVSLTHPWLYNYICPWHYVILGFCCGCTCVYWPHYKNYKNFFPNKSKRPKNIQISLSHWFSGFPAYGFLLIPHTFKRL